MITHTVMFRWSADAPPDQAERVAAGLQPLPSIIPEVRSYRFGSDAGVREGNYDFAVAATFDDLDGWRAYDRHEAHQRAVIELIRPFIAERAAVQFES